MGIFRTAPAPPTMPLPKYLVSYDLIGRPAADDYNNLIHQLREMKATQVLQSQWVLRSPLTAQQILAHLEPHVDPQDRLLVNVLGTAAQRNLLHDIAGL